MAERRLTRTSGAPMSCRRSSRFWGLGCPKIFHEIEDSLGKKRHRHQEFLAFLKTVEKQTPKALDLHLIVDNYATHKHEKVKTWLKQNNRVHLHFIPTSSSWLNLVERFFGLLTERQLRRGVFTSVKELEEAIMKFIDTHNESGKPFVWTKTTEEILLKVGRARTTLTNLHTI